MVPYYNKLDPIEVSESGLIGKTKSDSYNLVNMLIVGRFRKKGVVPILKSNLM